MIGKTSKAGVVPTREDGPGFHPPAANGDRIPFGVGRTVLPEAGGCTAPQTTGHAIAGPGGILGLKERRPSGLALRLSSPDPEDDRFEIAIVDQAGVVAQTLGPYPDEDVVAVWRSIAAASGLPLMVQMPDGRLDTPYPQLGPLRLGATHPRRRHGLLNHRRPRFLTRRKPAALPVRPLVYREAALSGVDEA